MNDFCGKNIVVAFSGGSDSDTVLNLLKECGYFPKSVFFDTGIEYLATYEHIDKVIRDGFYVEKIRAIKTVPIANKEYGVPFISKYVSEMLSRLQKHNFNFEDHGALEYDELVILYPNALMAIKWWCNKNASKRLNIERDKFLKEFLIENNGVNFKISNKCCDTTKKIPVEKYIKKNKIDLLIMGIRKEEAGIRSFSYTSCFVKNEKKSYSKFFPIFWWDDNMKKWYDETRKVSHSRAYTEYGFSRTGCAGCPYASGIENVLRTLEEKEPKLYKGILNIFKISYDTKRQYQNFRMEKENKNRLL